MKPSYEILQWHDVQQTQSYIWRAENGSPPPQKIIFADDNLTADDAYQLACEGCGIIWRGDFQQARQLLQALARRCDRPSRHVAKEKNKNKIQSTTPAQAFHLYRQTQSQRARTLAKILIPLNSDYTIPLRRAPNMMEACAEAYGKVTEATPNSLVSLREIQALIAAHEWRKKGVVIAELNAAIHPHFGVFSPLRGEYISLIANAALPATNLAFDIGTGTGVLAAVLAKRGVQQIMATDLDPRALICAQENLQRLGYSKQVKIITADLFPEGRAPLIVCNPPWIPARPASPIERAIFDPESAMLRGFLTGLADHLTQNGEGWLILSDIAEHLQLRSRAELLSWIAQAGLQVMERIEVKPQHPKAADQTNPLYSARAAEMTSLWRLKALVNNQK